MSKWFREFSADRLRDYVDPWAAKYVLGAYSGEVEAAISLAHALGNEKRGVVAVSMWRSRVPRTAYAAFLREVWLHDHNEVVSAAGTRRNLQHMFRYADFSKPRAGTYVQVWRGARGVALNDAQLGHSWTASRDIACWFSLFAVGTGGKAFGEPIVISATVSADDVAWSTDECGEDEVLIFRRVKGARIDGDRRDWLDCAARHSAKIKEHNRSIRGRKALSRA